MGVMQLASAFQDTLHSEELGMWVSLLFFFLEHAGELRIFVLRRREWPIYITDHPPWARMGDG